MGDWIVTWPLQIYVTFQHKSNTANKTCQRTQGEQKYQTQIEAAIDSTLCIKGSKRKVGKSQSLRGDWFSHKAVPVEMSWIVEPKFR